MKPSVDSRWSLAGNRAVVLENRALRVVVLPELGGRVWSIVYKPLDCEILWQNPRVAPRRVPFGSCYDDVWCGGWEELFPNDVPGTILGEKYPDHGEVWTIEWDWSAAAEEDSAAVSLSCRTPISGFRLERRITLRAGETAVHTEHRLTNEGRDTFPFLWKMHPAFRVSSDCRIDFPPMTVELEPAFTASLTGASATFPWPYADTPEGRIDLRPVPPETSKRAQFFYGTGYKEGWCAITDVAKRLSYGLTFSAAVFPSCWLFASFGGWRNHNVAILEPSTTYPFEIEKAIERGTARVLTPGASLETKMALHVETGLSKVSGLSPSGGFVE
jgi:Domain of unknown function (DUF5107)